MTLIGWLGRKTKNQTNKHRFRLQKRKVEKFSTKTSISFKILFPIQCLSLQPVRQEKQVVYLRRWNLLTLLKWKFHINILPGAVARSYARLPGMRTVAGSILTSGKTFFRWDLVMKTFLQPFSPFRWFKKGSCQLLAKEWALITGKLPKRLAQEQCG